MSSPIVMPVVPVKTANPGPLGLAGFGLTTVVLSAINAGLLAASILALSDPALRARVAALRAAQTDEVPESPL